MLNGGWIFSLSHETKQGKDAKWPIGDGANSTNGSKHCWNRQSRIKVSALSAKNETFGLKLCPVSKAAHVDEVRECRG